MVKEAGRPAAQPRVRGRRRTSAPRRARPVDEEDLQQPGSEPTPEGLQPARRAAVELRLLGGVALVVENRTVAVPTASARVIAYIALSAPNPVDRTKLGGVLWPDGSESRAAANLRSTLWRTRGVCNELLEITSQNVRLQPHVWLDIDNPIDAWWRVDGAQPMPKMIPELLPGWYDDWVVDERERVRQGVLHDLEASARALLDVGAAATAIDMALQAATYEPLRETPQRLLVEAHLLEGNVVEALRCFRSYASRLDAELGIRPSDAFAALIGDATTR